MNSDTKKWGILCKAGPVLVSFAARKEPNGCKTKLFTGWFRFHPSPMAMSSGQWLKYWYCGCHLFHALSSASSHLSRCWSWQQNPYSITLLASSLPKWRTILIFLITFTPPTFPWNRQSLVTFVQHCKTQQVTRCYQTLIAGCDGSVADDEWARQIQYVYDV